MLKSKTLSKSVNLRVLICCYVFLFVLNQPQVVIEELEQHYVKAQMAQFFFRVGGIQNQRIF